MKRRSGTTKAFTLVELLVVIAIISVLMAILLPSMAAARRAAQRNKCQANLRELARAWHMYLDDNDHHFFKGYEGHHEYGGKQGTYDFSNPDPTPKPLNSYVQIDPVTAEAAPFLCPADNGGTRTAGRYYDFYGSSYVTNYMLVGNPQMQFSPSDPCAALYAAVNDRIAELSNSCVTADPSTLIVMGDWGWLYVWDFRDLFNRAEWHAARDTHNLAFLDGHVTFEKLYKGAHATNRYNVVPFKDLIGQAVACQPPTP